MTPPQGFLCASPAHFTRNRLTVPEVVINGQRYQVRRAGWGRNQGFFAKASKGGSAFSQEEAFSCQLSTLDRRYRL